MVLEVRVFPFFFSSFSQGFCPICCLQDDNNWCLRETKEVAKVGERGAAACSLLVGAFLLGRAVSSLADTCPLN